MEEERSKKEERAAYMKAYRKEHREELNAYRREYYQKNLLRWNYPIDKAKAVESTKRWREAHREHCREYQREYQRQYRKRKAIEAWG